MYKNKEDARAYQREYFQKHKKELSVKSKERMRVWTNDNRERVNLRASEYGKMYRKRLKLQVLNHYGSKCICCGENHFELLTLDHINGGGQKQRSNLNAKNSAYVLYRWLIKNNFPEGFQILCFNCNISKGIYGYCPHSKVHT